MRAAKKSATLRTLGHNVRFERKNAGLTQEELAEKLGISVAYLSLIERGGRNPPFTTVVHIAGKLGLTVGALSVEVA